MSELPPRDSLRNNSLWLLLARMSAQALAILFTSIVARKLGVDEYGHFALIASLLVVGNTFTNFGTDTLLIRETARAGTVTSLASRASSLQLLFSLLYCAAMLALRDSALLVYTLALFPLAVFSVNNALLRALNRMDLFWKLSFASGILQVIAAFLSADVFTLCLILLAGQLLVSILSLAVCTASLPAFTLFPLKDFRPILRSTLPFAALTILIVLMQRLGVLFVSAQLGDSATGLFSSVTRVVDGLKFGHYAILGALLPALSSGAPNARLNFLRGFIVLFSLSFVFSAGLTLFSKPVILILFGNHFVSASSLLSILGWSLLPYTITSFVSYDLIVRNLENSLVKAALFSQVLYIGAFWILLPIWGLRGAVWAALLGEFLQSFTFISYFLIARRKVIIQ